MNINNPDKNEYLKYLKYKSKYLDLKDQDGGGSEVIIFFNKRGYLFVFKIIIYQIFCEILFYFSCNYHVPQDFLEYD